MLEMVKKQGVRAHVETDLGEQFDTNKDYLDAVAHAESLK
jgi:hypothetical protein